MSNKKSISSKYLPHFIKTTIISMCCLTTACGSLNTWPFQKKGSADSAAPTATPPLVTPPPMPSDPIYKAGIVNTASLISQVGLQPWLAAGHHGKNVTIGILDNGFGGLQDSIAQKHLPPMLTVAAPQIQNESSTPHGTKLAEIIFAMTSGSAQWTASSQAPTIKLYNANGFTNLSHAVDQAIADHVDMIVYSQVWEFGGNFDGQGFINGVVDRAIKAGILWINAAGNYGSSVWQDSVRIQSDGTLALPFNGHYVRMVVNDAATQVKISLAWNDFTNSKDYHTNQDLDLDLFDSKQQPVASSHLIQDGKDHGNDPLYSAHAHELIETVLDPGIYFLKVTAKSHNFLAASRFRLAADGANISFIDQSPNASIMIPADNANVLTVGANDDSFSAHGLTANGISKPDLLMPSIVKLESNISVQGSSTAAATAAAAIAVYKDVCGPVTLDHARGILKRISGQSCL